MFLSPARTLAGEISRGEIALFPEKLQKTALFEQKFWGNGTINSDLSNG
jgi:hypothetical protein